MSRSRYTGPKLPGVLLDKVQSGGISKNKRDIPRKDRRKAERQAKRQPRRTQQFNVPARRHPTPRSSVREASLSSGEDQTVHTAPARRHPAKDAKPVKSILKRKEALPEADSEGATDQLDEDEQEGEDGSDDASEEEEVGGLTVPRQSKRKLDEDDAEIAALEKKLGIKSKKAKGLQEDGLDWLAGESGGESDGEEGARPEDVDWLKGKRRKAGTAGQNPSVIEGKNEDSTSDSDVHVGAELDGFEGFDSEDDADLDEDRPPLRKAQKENPYVAPGTAKGISDPTAKYVPPSLRKPAPSDEEMLRHLHRQVQGKVNKVSESNMISILREVEDIYKENARQHVTSTLIDILIGLMTADVAHPDTVLITNAAFAAAVYKVVGTDFGAQLLERVVERHDYLNGRKTGEGKQPLNLLAFLSYLYNFQVVGGGLLFDYIRLLLSELTEDNTEMLLRIMRISGQQLRQDDPSALKDIVMLLQKLVTQTGEDNLSVRTKFMIETINNLKNNRVKTGLAASSIAAEHTNRMKKTLGTLNARAKASEPLRITLADINDTEKKGKWWLIGASYHDPAKLASATNTLSAASKHDDSDTGYESSTPGSVNLTKLARKSGMNTDVRRAIFISLLSAADYKDAHVRLMKLRLKNKQQLEIPRVMATCVGGEEAYNPYYALVARRFCAEHAMRKAFQFTLWNFWREVENEGEEGVDGEEGVLVSVRKVVNLAKFYAALVADESLSIAVLKKLDFTYLPSKESMFVEVFLTSIFAQLRKESRQSKDDKPLTDDTDADKVFEERVRRTFTCAGASEMLSGLQYFIRSTVEGSELTRTKKEKRALDVGCKVAIEALVDAEKQAPMAEQESEGPSSLFSPKEHRHEEGSLDTSWRSLCRLLAVPSLLNTLSTRFALSLSHLSNRRFTEDFSHRSALTSSILNIRNKQDTYMHLANETSTAAIDKQTMTRTPSSTAEQPAFFTLPPEIRNTIYELALVLENDQFENEDELPRNDVLDSNYVQPALLRTCKQIREEAISIYYAMNRFWLLIDCFDASPALEWIDTARQYVSLKDLHVVWDWGICGTYHGVWPNVLRLLQHAHAGRLPHSEPTTMWNGPDNSDTDGHLQRLFTIALELAEVPWESVERALQQHVKGTEIGPPAFM